MGKETLTMMVWERNTKNLENKWNRSWMPHDSNIDAVALRYLFQKKKKITKTLLFTLYEMFSVFQRSKCRKRSSKSQRNDFKVLLLAIISAIGSQSTANRSKWKGFHTVVEAINRVQIYLIDWKTVLATWQRANI